MDTVTKLPPEDWRNHKSKLFGFVVAFYIDIMSTLLLYGVANNWDGAAWYPDVFLGRFLHFSMSTADIIIASLFRIVLIPILTVLAVFVGSPHKAIERAETEIRQTRQGQRKRMSSLVINKEESHSLISHGDFVELEDNVEDRLPVEVLTEKEKHAIKKRSEKYKNLIMGFLFMILMAGEIMAGIKCVVFHFPANTTNYTLSAILCGGLVLWMNLELYISKELIGELTKDTGHLFKGLHSHPLYYTDKVAGHLCDLCRRRGLREAYRCNACDYDLCLICTKKRNKDRGEGLLRGDSGVKEEKDISNWQYMKKALAFAKPHVFLVLLALVFLIVNSVVNLMLPNYQGKILDDVIRKDVDTFQKDIYLYVGLSVSMGLFGGIRNLCFNVVGRKMGNEVRNKLYASIMMQDMAFFDGSNTGDLTSRLSQNTSAMIAPAQSMLSTLLSSFISLFGGLIMCFYTSWRLSILALTTIGPIIMVVRVYAKWSGRINKQIWASLGDANALATEALNNIRTVRAFSNENVEIQKYHETCNEALDKGIKDAWAGAFTYALTEYIELSISVLLLWYGGSVAMVNQGILTIGNLITFQLYWNMLRNSYTSLVENVNSFTRAGGAAQRVMSLLDNLPDINPDEGEKITEVAGDIELQEVEFFYQMRPDVKVLKGISLKIRRGQVCALVGKSGGGKSTIIHLLMRFYDPKGGGILLDGKDLRTLNPISLRKHIGIVAQETQLFNMTIEENIAYGMDKYKEEDLILAAKLSNAHDFIMEFDEGYETRVGERGVRLSGGQKQRIALARVFLRKPKLLFLDEATSALDSESEALVQDAIDNLISRGGCTVVLVAHRLSTVINADTIGVVHQGKIVEQGTHDELLKHKGIYAQLVKRQVTRMANTLDDTDESKKKKPNDVIDTLIDQIRLNEM